MSIARLLLVEIPYVCLAGLTKSDADPAQLTGGKVLIFLGVSRDLVGSHPILTFCIFLAALLFFFHSRCTLLHSPRPRCPLNAACSLMAAFIWHPERYRQALAATVVTFQSAFMHLVRLGRVFNYLISGCVARGLSQ